MNAKTILIHWNLVGLLGLDSMLAFLMLAFGISWVFPAKQALILSILEVCSSSMQEAQ
jgi:hypothetical protein